MYKILIADDEKEIVELLKLYLENDGYEIVVAYDGEKAWSKIINDRIDLAILDVMMPKLDGFHLLKKIREKMNLPVIILSAKDQDVNKILGLGLGADDYISKPFNPLELMARVSAQLRRFYNFNPAYDLKNQEIINIGSLKLDTGACSIHKNCQEIVLTSTEYKILQLLMEQPGRVFTRAQIFESIWGESSQGDDNTIMVHIRKIREKIEDDPGNPYYLKTIRGLGYRFEKII